MFKPELTLFSSVSDQVVDIKLLPNPLESHSPLQCG